MAEDSSNEVPPTSLAGDGPASVETQSSKQAKLPLKKRFLIGAAGLLGGTLIRLLAMTFRYRLHYRGIEHIGRHLNPELEAAKAAFNGPVLFALWHGSAFVTLGFWRDKGLCVITSRSTDGQVLAKMLHGLGFTTVHGSSSRGGARAMLDMARVLREGTDVAVTVDGPRGPAAQVKPGIILVSKITQRPIIPIATTAGRFWQFRSWDRFRLPFPLTKAHMIVGEPMQVPPDADEPLMEQMRKELEERIRSIQAEVDARVKPSIWKRADRPPKERAKQGDK